MDEIWRDFLEKVCSDISQGFLSIPLFLSCKLAKKSINITWTSWYKVFFCIFMFEQRTKGKSVINFSKKYNENCWPLYMSFFFGLEWNEIKRKKYDWFMGIIGPVNYKVCHNNLKTSRNSYMKWVDPIMFCLGLFFVDR